MGTKSSDAPQRAGCCKGALEGVSGPCLPVVELFALLIFWQWFCVRVRKGASLRGKLFTQQAELDQLSVGGPLSITLQLPTPSPNRWTQNSSVMTSGWHGAHEQGNQVKW